MTLPLVLALIYLPCLATTRLVLNAGPLDDATSAAFCAAFWFSFLNLGAIL
jgi:hypothetical protein